MKKQMLLLLFFLPVSSLLKAQIIIEDSIFTTTLDLVGSGYNNAIIRNCTFKNTIISDGLRIANANNVIIDSCIFYNIQGNGIRLHSSGTSDGVIIKNCSFDSIYGNGILSAEQHSNTQILNNSFNWIGLDTQGAAQGAPHHGIYFIGDNYIIAGNHIRNIYNNDGNCVSVRSNGIVRNNVLYNATKNGISYFSDHPNVGNSLLVENNIVYNCQRGVTVADGGEAYVDTTIIRFNTLITQDLMDISIGSGLSMVNKIYGNILIRKDGSPLYIFANSPYDSTKNLLSDGDVGFVNFANNDYHITNSSPAYSFATGLTDFPSDDIDSDARGSSRLDAGADQFFVASSTELTEFKPFTIYPNPSNSEINLDLKTSVPFTIEISDLFGKVLIIENNQKKIDISKLKTGIYTISVKQGQSCYQQKLMKQ
jgi:hypothetical protein